MAYDTNLLSSQDNVGSCQEVYRSYCKQKKKVYLKFIVTDDSYYMDCFTSEFSFQQYLKISL